MKIHIKKFGYIIIALLVIGVSLYGYRYVKLRLDENRVLKEVISRLEAHTRVAEVLVTGVTYDEGTGKYITTIKFEEHDIEGNPGEAKYFTFAGNIIQFQSLVIRFDDLHIKEADKLKGKSAYLFWKVFMLDGANTQEYEITQINSIPEGYKVEGLNHPYEEKLWGRFWKYALDPETARSMGIKNAQIEAPGSMFLPGMIYTLNLEHDGGIRIDASPIPHILKGEKIRR